MDLSNLVVDPATNTAFLIFSTLVPVLVALVKQAGLPHAVNALIALLVYVVVGAAAVLVSGVEFSLDNIVPAVTVLTVVGTAAYNIFWNQLGRSDDGSTPSIDTRLMTVTSINKPVE